MCRKYRVPIQSSQLPLVLTSCISVVHLLQWMTNTDTINYCLLKFGGGGGDGLHSRIVNAYVDICESSFFHAQSHPFRYILIVFSGPPNGK